MSHHVVCYFAQAAELISLMLSEAVLSFWHGPQVRQTELLWHIPQQHCMRRIGHCFSLS